MQIGYIFMILEPIILIVGMYWAFYTKKEKRNPGHCENCNRPLPPRYKHKCPMCWEQIEYFNR